MQDKGVVYVVCHPLLNRRCTKTPRVYPPSKCCIGWVLTATYSSC